MIKNKCSLCLLISGLLLVFIGSFYTFLFQNSKEVLADSYSDSNIKVGSIEGYDVISNIVDDKNLVVFIKSNFDVDRYLDVSVEFRNSLGDIVKEKNSKSIVFANGYYIFDFSIPDLNNKSASDIIVSLNDEKLYNNERSLLNLDYNYSILPLDDVNNSIEVKLVNKSFSVSVFKGQYVVLEDNKVLSYGPVNLENFIVNKVSSYPIAISKAISDKDFKLLVYPIDYI